MKTYILNIIMIPLVIKKQGDGLNSYELGHSLIFLALFENIIMNTYINIYIYENINVYCVVHIYINIDICHTC